MSQARAFVSKLAVALLALVGAVAAGCTAADGQLPELDDGVAETAASDESDVIFGAADLSAFAPVDGFAQSGVLTTPSGATRSGFLVDLWEDVKAPVSLEVRGISDDGSTTAWIPAEVTWQEETHAVARAELPGLFTATQIRLPIEQAPLVENLIYGAVVPTPEETASADDGSGLGHTAQALTSDFSDLVQPRSAWGARATKCSTADKSKYRIAIHHTFSQNSSSSGYEARLRSFQAYHMDTRGWCDIGYHFLVTDDGRIWEGRAAGLLGAHVANNNTGNVGVSWVGCFHAGACDGISAAQTPPQAMIDAGGLILGRLSKLYGIGLSTSSVKPHRGHSGASTECPGDNLASRIGDMIALAGSGSPPPASPPPASPPPASPPPASPPGGFSSAEQSWSCSGTTGNHRAASGSYYVTTFGCYTDSNGNPQGDPGDNCIPWCKDGAASQGRKSAYDALCAGLSGPDCERKVKWYSADADRFGCASRLLLKNQKTGKQVVIAVLDRGPACWVEDKVDHWVLDLSNPTTDYLFGGQQGATDKAEVLVTEVADSVALGPYSESSPPPPPESPPPASPPPSSGAKGRALGVVWDASKTSSPAASGNVRLGSATVTVAGGASTGVRSTDAYFGFDLAAGTYTITASATGYQSASKTVTVSSGKDEWASIGLVR